MVSTHIGFPTETVIVFIALSVGAIFIDLFMHRHDKPISLKSAALWSVFWVIVAMAFAGFLYVHHGAEVASLFVTGYALEKVLSVDNLFVMMAIFSWFSVPDRYRHRVLYWGIIGPSSSGGSSLPLVPVCSALALMSNWSLPWLLPGLPS
jgi:tellurite resistance protein TerC